MDTKRPTIDDLKNAAAERISNCITREITGLAGDLGVWPSAVGVDVSFMLRKVPSPDGSLKPDRICCNVDLSITF